MACVLRSLRNASRVLSACSVQSGAERAPPERRASAALRAPAGRALRNCWRTDAERAMFLGA
eukprot:10053751-Alexandrium_andersonii.AAC.1